MSFDIFSEIITTLKRNKLRTFLTGFSISWGIFMIIVLLSAGNGLKNGVTSNFEEKTNNIITLYAGYTNIEYKGYPKMRRITMDNRDSLALAHSFPEIQNVVPVYTNWGNTIFYGKKTLSTNMEAVFPEYAEYNTIEVTDGRFINRKDISDIRKVCIIADKDAVLLFGDEEPIGKEVLFHEINFLIVGVYKAYGNWRNSIYIPYSTAMKLYNPSGNLSEIAITVNGIETTEESITFSSKLRERLSKIHDFHPEDYSAIQIYDRMRDYQEVMSIFKGINIFIWLIGIGTLIAGIVGISNIMLITVKERTKEFGIRKAIGAKPSSILKLIVLESLIITTSFGYIGMIIGMGLMEIVNMILVKFNIGIMEGMAVFKNPTADLGSVIIATIVLIIAGVMAGYVPAKRAVSIKPIEALRYE